MFKLFRFSGRFQTENGTRSLGFSELWLIKGQKEMCPVSGHSHEGVECGSIQKTLSYRNTSQTKHDLLRSRGA